MSEQRSDGELIAACGEEPSHFAVIFDRHFPAIHAYVRRRAGPAIADDLAAETFVAAFEGRASFDCSRPSARPWLFGIATNKLRNHRRRERRELIAYARTGIDPIGDEIGEADDRLTASAAVPRLLEGLAALSADELEVLLLHAWTDLSNAEVAEALAIPLGTVKSRLSRARARLAAHLAADRSQIEEIVIQPRSP